MNGEMWFYEFFGHLVSSCWSVPSIFADICSIVSNIFIARFLVYENFTVLVARRIKNIFVQTL